MDLKHVTVAGIPTLLRDDLPTPGSTAMFFPSDGEAGAQWLRYAAFDTPSAVIAGRAQAFVQEPHDIALGLLELLPRPTPTSSFILFGYSAGTVVACLAALALLEIEPAAPVRLILANPFAEWWPPTSWQHMPWAKPVLDQVEADPKLRARFEQRGDGHEILRRAAAKGLRTAIILSGQTRQTAPAPRPSQKQPGPGSSLSPRMTTTLCTGCCRKCLPAAEPNKAWPASNGGSPPSTAFSRPKSPRRLSSNGRAISPRP